MKRLPLLYEKNDKKNAEIRCKEIADTLIDCYSVDNQLGFMNGLAGISCFFFHYYSLTGDNKYKKHGYHALELILDSIEKGFSSPSLSSGLSGIHWLFKYLGKQGFISSDESNSLSGLTPLFRSYANNCFEVGNYDYLHGGLGTIMTEYGYGENCLNQKYNTNFFQLANTIKNGIYKLAVTNPDKSISWQSKNPVNGDKEVNLGLAHGIPSILLVLSRIYECTKDDSIISDIIAPGMTNLLSYKKNHLESTSYFPHNDKSVEGDLPSRLAWCYGDPGVGIAILQIGKICSNIEWMNLGISILKGAALRMDQKDTKVYDACLCHGSSGLAMIFLSAAFITGENEFYQAARHWIRTTNYFGENTIKPGAYIFQNSEGDFIPKYNLLEGVSGVGLSLIAFLEEDLPGWERVLMIS